MGRFDRKKKDTDQDVPELICPVQRLMNIINNRMDKNASHPAMMPEKQQEAAEWWKAMQEPMGKDEKATLEWTAPKKATDSRRQYWKTPYADRIATTLIEFYKLSHADQMYIIDLHSQGIWWRGDSIKFMKLREKVDMGRIDKAKLFTMMKTVIARA